MPNLNADPLRIKRVLYNLLTNAIKYTLPGGSINLEVSITDGKFMTIKITDTGIGISEDDLPYIFDEFFQAEKIHEKSTQGVGLGLSIAKLLVELHHGTIEISSTVDIGTVAIITLPITDIGNGEVLYG
jgi:two-component system phosphate regulon sensor histidine kinase PhoR